MSAYKKDLSDYRVVATGDTKAKALREWMAAIGTGGLTTGDTGTSGHKIPYLDGSTNIWSGLNTFLTTAASTILTVGGAVAFDPVLRLNGNAGQSRTLVGMTAGVTRWNTFFGNATAEGGANAGSDYQINAYTDAGALIGTPLFITRSSMAVSLGATLFVTGALTGTGNATFSKAGAQTLVTAGSAIAFDAYFIANGNAGQNRGVRGHTAGLLRWLELLGNTTAEGGANAGSNYTLSAYADDGTTLIGTPISIVRSSLATTFSGAVTASSTLTVTGATQHNGAVTVNNVATLLTGTDTNGSNAILQFKNTFGSAMSRYLRITTAGAFQHINNAFTTAIHSVDDSGNVTQAGVLTLPNGAIGAPAINLGDAATGLYRNASQEITFVGNGVAAGKWSAFGMTALTGGFFSVDGTVSAPGFRHTSEGTSGRYKIGTNNFGESVSSTLKFDWNTTRLLMGSGFDLVLDSGAPTNNLSAGYRRIPAASITTGTPIAADSAKIIKATGGVTLPANVFADGDEVIIYAGGSSRTITQGASLTMTKEVSGTTGNATLAAWTTAVAVYDLATTCHITNVT